MSSFHTESPDQEPFIRMTKSLLQVRHGGKVLLSTATIKSFCEQKIILCLVLFETIKIFCLPNMKSARDEEFEMFF